MDETTLISALKSGDDGAFEHLVRTTSGRLTAVARRFVRTDEDAQDVVQTAYLQAFRALARFDGQARLSTWLHRIVVNVALTKLRSARRKPEAALDPLLPAFHPDGHHVEQFTDWGPSAEELLERKETRATVRACIEQLPDDYRTVLLLRDIEDLSTAETAELLHLTQAAVKTRLHRARQALSSLLRQRYAPASVTTSTDRGSQ